MDANLNKAIRHNARQFDKLVKSLPVGTRKEIAMPAAIMMQEAIRARTPVASKIIKRYGGNGKVLSVYMPGNLKRSIQILPLAKASHLYVGPVTRGGTRGIFNGDKVDGWYAHIVELKVPFIRPAVDAMKGTVMLKLRKDAEMYMNKQIATIK